MHRTATRSTQLLFTLFALVLFGIPAARAQTGLYGEAGASKLNFPTDQWTPAGTFGIYSDFAKVPPVRFGADLRFSVLRPADNTTLFSILIGPRVSFHPHVVPLTVYAEGLIGSGRYSFGNNVGPRNRLEFQAVGGVDHALVPHLDWRVIEFSYAGLSTHEQPTLHPMTLSSGIVLRF